MKRFPRPRRTAAELSGPLQHQLNMYALAASAAGVGVLVLSQPADAKIVYTTAHRVIRLHDSSPIDLNHDGKADFTIKNTSLSTDIRNLSLFVIPASSAKANGIIGYRMGTADFYLASALKPGAPIASGRQFLTREGAGMFRGAVCPSTFCFPSGEWKNVQDRYLGLRFQIKGHTHYGWARLTVKVISPPNPSITAILTGYAYETISGKSIKAGQTKEAEGDPANEELGPGAFVTSPIPDIPQPATLGALALGAPGLAIWRREESVADALWSN